MMKAIIVEDEQLAANRLKRMLKEVVPDIEVVTTCETVEDTVDVLSGRDDIEIIFLDIHVADGNSFELFNILEVKCNVIFTTAYDQYAIEAFRKNATDYLLKPLKKEQLAEAVAKAKPVRKELLKELNSTYKKRIIVKFMAKLKSIKTNEIAYVFSKNKISYFYMTDGQRYPSDYKLQQLEELLDPNIFFRANRQFIINIDAVESMHKHQASRIRVTVNPPIDETIIISTDKTPLFKDWLNR